MALELGPSLDPNPNPVPEQQGRHVVELTVRVRSNTGPAHVKSRYTVDEAGVIILSVDNLSPPTNPFPVSTPFSGVTRRLTLRRTDSSVKMIRVRAHLLPCDAAGAPTGDPEQECATQVALQ